MARLMEDYLWEKRVVIAFAPTPIDAALRQQQEAFLEQDEAFAERDVEFWEITAEGTVRLNGQFRPQLAAEPFYSYFKVKPDQFTLLLLGKDGEEKLREDAPITPERLYLIIDAMPMRQDEMGEASEN